MTGKLLCVFAALMLSLTACSKSKSGKSTPRRSSDTTGAYPTIPQGQQGEERRQQPVVRTRVEVKQTQTQTQNGNQTQTKYVPIDQVEEGDESEDLNEVRQQEDIEDVDPTILGEPQKCGAAYKRAEAEWFPGILYPPAQQPILTGGVSPRGFKYTDSYDDSLMAILADKYESLTNRTDCLKDASRELSARIAGVYLTTDVKATGISNLTIELYDGSKKGKAKSQKRKIAINFTGQLNGKMTADRANVKMVQTNKVGNLRFEAKLMCMDQDSGCQTTVIYLKQLTKNGEVCRIALIAYRHGNAHITMNEQDWEYASVLMNKNKDRMAQFIANTSTVQCAQTLREVEMGQRPNMPTCAVERMRYKCEKRRIKGDFAKVAGLKTWSVLYGAARFTLYLDDVLTINGPLVSGPARPIYDTYLPVKGKGVSYVSLRNNDGAGQLNFELGFKGKPEAKMYFSVSSIFKHTKVGYTKDSVAYLQEPDETVIKHEGQVEKLPGKQYDPQEDDQAEVSEQKLNSNKADKENDQQTQEQETQEDGDNEGAIPLN